MLTLPERIYVIQCYGVGEISIPAVIRLFNLKFPDKILVKSTVSRLIKKFLTTGSVHDIPKKKNQFNEDDVSTMLAKDSVREQPKLSLRQRSAQIGISKAHLQRIYKAIKVKPYKVRFLHTLEEGDEARRLEFCLTLGEKIIADSDFHKNIIFSDESTFTTNGVPSSQNCRYWSEDNPEFVVNSRRQYFKKINVWCAISYHCGVIGPYFVEGRLNQYSYLDILNQFVDDLPYGARDNAYFQHDGCPAHSTLRVCEWLNQHFQGRWIANAGPILWPPRSPDLTIMDFFFWGRIKQIVYSERIPNDEEVLKNRIRNAIDSISVQEIQATFRAFRRRIEECAIKGGGLIE